MKLTKRELGTVLAALRYYQTLHPAMIPQDFEDIATNGGEFQPMKPREIDKLCEHLNHG